MFSFDRCESARIQQLVLGISVKMALFKPGVMSSTSSKHQTFNDLPYLAAMRKTVVHLILILILGGLVNGCIPRHANILSLGAMKNAEFKDTVSTEVSNGLIIVPVMIRGETYRFLFDTGAPLSISHQIQQKHGFKRISKGHIVDSDQNRQKIQYVQVDSLKIADIPFYGQTAFVADFRANPVLECLQLDGILGSNLMRYCNWTIDYETSQLIFASALDSTSYSQLPSLPFRYDRQFDLMVDLSIGNKPLKNLEVDYGSNGVLMIPEEIFDTLQLAGIITEPFHTVGQKQSGLIGEAVKTEQRIAFGDSLVIGDVILDDIMIRSGRKGLIGHDILSRFIVSIDSKRELLYLQKKELKSDNRSFGFVLQPDDQSPGLRVQRLVEGSPAEQAGLQIGTLVIKINDLDLTKESAFCDYVSMMNVPPDSLVITYAGKNSLTSTITIRRERLRHR